MKTLYLFLALLLVSCGNVDSKKDKIEDARLKKQAEVEERRVFTIKKYMGLADSLKKVGAAENAVVYMDSAIAIAIDRKGALSFEKASYLFENRNYIDATEAYQIALVAGFKEDTCYFQRALCFEKVRDRQAAVNELKVAIALGHDDSKKLHERINPERRRVSGYNIRCCDGSISYSQSRRGTCSHHGGVCNWNEPVYETYRKY